MRRGQPLLPTTVIGSYPRPEWLRNTIRSFHAGKSSAEELQSAYDDASLLVLKEHELAGVDIITDGEVRRDEMVEYFAERMDGFRFYGDVRVWGTAHYRKPAVVSEIRYRKPLLTDEFLFSKKSTVKPLKVTITGPYTLADWSYNEYYTTKGELVQSLAKAVNRELLNLQSAGAQFIQVDEPALPTHPGEVELARDGFNTAISGISVKTAVHVCYGDYSKMLDYLNGFNTSQFALEFANRNFSDLKLFDKSGYNKEIGLGVIDVHNKTVESKEQVAQAIERAMNYFPAEKIYVNPDCGLKLLPKKIAYQKLVAMVEGVTLVRERLEKQG